MSFFDEVVKFFSQIVDGQNSYMDVFRRLLDTFLDAIKWVRDADIISSDGKGWGWIFPLVVLIIVINFVRGA